MNLDGKKRIIIIASILLVVLVVGLIIFINKSNKEEKQKSKENNYTLLFQYVNKDTKDVEQDMQFIFKDGKLNKIKLTMYFIEDNITKLIADEYKNDGSFKNVTYTKNSVTLEYTSAMMKEYSGLSKDELITLVEGQGYKYIK